MPSTSLKAKLSQVKSEFENSVKQMKTSAGSEATRLEDRYRKFQDMRKTLAETVIKPRLEEVAAEFPGVKHALSSDVDGGSLVLTFPRTPERSALIEVTLSVGHDDNFEKVLFNYELRIIPVFIEFEKTSSMTEPLDNVNMKKVEEWLDNVLLGFAKTYMNMQFVEQYQSNMSTDPVLNRRFPTNLAAGNIEHKGVTYQFASAESMQLFKANPDKYLRIGSDAEKEQQKVAADKAVGKQTTEPKPQPSAAKPASTGAAKQS